MANLISRYTNWLHAQWPSGKVEVMPAVFEDGTTNISGVRIVGDLTGVPLLKFSADTGAKAITAFQEEKDFKPGALADGVDVAIIGAGVSGISAAIEAEKAGLKYVVFESQESFSTIKNFPRKKPIFTYPTAMEPAGELRFKADVKEGLLDELEEQRQQHNIQPEQAEIDHVESASGHLVLHFKKQNKREPLKAQRVVVAIGRTGNFRKLNVPGEHLSLVSNRLIAATEFSGKNVLVVGGGDSALEAAISLAESGAQTMLSYRRKEFQRPKPDNVEAIQRLEAEGKLTLKMGTNIQDISEGKVTLCDESSCDTDIEADNVFILIGREPPLDFFRKSKMSVIGDRGPQWWAGLIAFLLFCTFVYHWKGYVEFLGLPNTNLWQLSATKSWFPFNIGQFGEPGSLLHSIIQQARTEPPFWYTLVYSLIIVIFGWKRIRRRKTPYVTRQTITLSAIQVIPLFILPYVLLPWMGANGAFTSGGFGEWFGMTFLSNGPGTEPTAYWRAFGFILAWPLFVYNVFTEQPLWGWLILSLIQTFVIIPLIIFRWGKGAYCGWICSCGAMAETLGDQHRHKMPHGAFWNKFNMLGQAILAIALLLLVWRVLGWLFVDSFFDKSFQSALDKLPVANYKYLVDLWLAGALGYGLYFHFSGRTWCRFACPLAALMHIYARFSRFRIFADKKKCISCNACTSVCHQGIDIMNFANKGRGMEDPECVRCSACVQVCPTGTLNFGHYDGKGKPRLDRLWASPIQRSEAELAGTPIDAYLAEAEKRV